VGLFLADHGRRWGRVVSLVAVLGVTAALGACGSPGSGAAVGATAPTVASSVPGSAPPAATSSAQATPGGPPTAHYILMCSLQAVPSYTGTLTWLNPTTLQVLYQETIVPPPADGPAVVPVGGYSTTGFAPTPTAAASGLLLGENSPGSGCGSWQLSADQTSIAGIDVEGNSAVPATYNLLTGAVTDTVQPPSTSGFAAATPVTYFGAYYAPDGTSVWSQECDASDEDLTVHAPDGTAEANIPSTVTAGSAGAASYTYCSADGFDQMVDSYLTWLPGASAPTIVTQDIAPSGTPYPDNLAAVPATASGTSTPLTAAQGADLPLLDPSLLPKSNWTFTYIHRSPNGSKAAFIAQNSTTGAWAVFTVDGAGKTTPQQVNAALPGCSTTCGDVLAYNP